MPFSFKVCLSGIFLFACTGFLFADTIILKSGAEVDGQIVNQSQTSITIRTPAGVRTIGKGEVRRVLYGDTYRKQQDELKRKKEEEQKRKEEEERKRQEEEERRKAEEAKKAEEAARQEENKEKAAEEARRQEEQERLERERQELREEQKDQDRLARNPWAMWIFAGPAEASLLPDALRENLTIMQLLGAELNYRPARSESQGAVFGFGFSAPVWDLIFLEANGRATGQWQDFFALEGGRDSRFPSEAATRQGFGIGDYGRMIRSTGDLHLGYKITATELADLLGFAMAEPVFQRLELEPLIGYKSRQHDATLSTTTAGFVSFGPAFYLASESADLFSRARGPSWGLRMRYAPLEDIPLKLELGLYGYRMSADTEYSLERNVIYNTPGFQQLNSKLNYHARIEGGALSLAALYGLSENLDVFLRLRGESADYRADRLTLSLSDSANPASANSVVPVSLLGPAIAPLLNNTEESGSMEIGLRRQF